MPRRNSQGEVGGKERKRARSLFRFFGIGTVPPPLPSCLPPEVGAGGTTWRHRVAMLGEGRSGGWRRLQDGRGAGEAESEEKKKEYLSASVGIISALSRSLTFWKREFRERILSTLSRRAPSLFSPFLPDFVFEGARGSRAGQYHRRRRRVAVERREEIARVSPDTRSAEFRARAPETLLTSLAGGATPARVVLSSGLSPKDRSSSTSCCSRLVESVATAEILNTIGRIESWTSWLRPNALNRFLARGVLRAFPRD